MVSPKCMQLEEEFKSLIKVWLSVIASLCYCYFISSKIPKGLFRFLSILPILYLFTILPLQLSTVLPTGITAFLITWLTNFKLLLFTFDLGPLSSNPSKPLPLFLSFACLPIRLTHKQTDPSNQSPFKLKLYLILPIKALLVSVLLIGLNDHKQKFHPIFILGLYCTIVYLLLDVILGLCNIVINVALGIELELPSDEPYLSTSLRDFWGRRWNLMVTHLLRHTVYMPVRSVMSNTILGTQWASVPGVMASFLVSGLMHELLFYYSTRATPTWEVTCFFVLHGVCVVVEFCVRKRSGHKGRLHWAASGPITVAFVISTAAWLFFPPLLRDGVDERLMKEFKHGVDCMMPNFYRFY
ncbi:probable long-chain-alcohol O-fatty-acyltransferase 5 [Abrus precatorius]|uniref:Probable long-chain-alcohol O-fatty-acyltransferase 5 n=1 Tax=Abrus precatorius TaxID=3816 RepID=A0A8B8MJ39_ABRPR|nr:probable long-chain-alcohol O-fatty-acyltransferase 5 [Abrus precatorius]